MRSFLPSPIPILALLAPFAALALATMTTLRAQEQEAVRPASGYPPEQRIADGRRIDLPLASMLVPAGFTPAADGSVPLCVHFQGAVYAAEENFARMQRGGVLIASTIRGLSSAFATPYRDPRAFAELLAAGERELAAHCGRPAGGIRFAPIAITFWSAGYGAVREILRDPDLYGRIDALISADSIYAEVVAPGVRAPRIEQMVDFLRFAQDAARGQRTFVLVHGSYATEYASTAETASLLCAGVAAGRGASSWITELGIPVAREAHTGRFHCYEFAAATKEIHVDCLYTVPELARRHLPPTTPPARLRVVCWNVHHGRGLDGRVDVARIAAELAALAPDLVCLQEVDVGVQRSGRIDLARELAQRLSMHAVFGKNIDYQGGDYGNAILSRWPLVGRHNHHYRMLREDEQRGLLCATADTPAGRVAFATTHLEANAQDDERRAQVPEILGAFRSRGLAFVAGDFNDLPQRPVHRLLTAVLDDAWDRAGDGDDGTYPSASPQKRIDWLLLRRDGSWRAKRAHVAPTAASDHRPLVVELERVDASGR